MAEVILNQRVNLKVRSWITKLYVNQTRAKHVSEAGPARILYSPGSSTGHSDWLAVDR
jgi:hypothetical protein